MQTWTYLADDESKTAQLGAALAGAVGKLSEASAESSSKQGTGLAPRGAWVMALVGPLGAGKTQLVRAIAVGFGVDRREVSSPTYVLVQQYPAPLRVTHFDAYRLRDVREFEELGVEEYFAGEGICLVEWADRVVEVLPEEHLTVEIEIAGPHSRRFRFAARGRCYEELLELMARQLSEPGG